jgi:hypothetical protein
MTTGFTRSQLRDADKRLVEAIDHAATQLDGLLYEWVKNRVAMEAVGGGSIHDPANKLLWPKLRAWLTAMTRRGRCPESVLIHLHAPPMIVPVLLNQQQARQAE